MVTGNMLPCPWYLHGKARREWQRVSIELYDAGLLTNADRHALAEYCLAYARFDKAENKGSKSSPKGVRK
jgi:P27 family predicted phage terminase small subunit